MSCFLHNNDCKRKHFLNIFSVHISFSIFIWRVYFPLKGLVSFEGSGLNTSYTTKSSRAFYSYILVYKAISSKQSYLCSKYWTVVLKNVLIVDLFSLDLSRSEFNPTRHKTCPCPTQTTEKMTRPYLNCERERISVIDRQCFSHFCDIKVNHYSWLTI